MPAVHLGFHLGRRDAVGEQFVLAPQELQGVRGERLDLHRDHVLGLGHRRGHQLIGQRRSLGDDRLADVQGLAVQPDRGAVGDLDEHVRPDSVHDRDARLEQQLGAEVGVTPGNADRDVDHGGDLPPDQLLGADPVQVGMIDNGDLAGIEPLGDVLRPAIHPGHSDDAGQRLLGLTPR